MNLLQEVICDFENYHGYSLRGLRRSKSFGAVIAVSKPATQLLSRCPVRQRIVALAMIATLRAVSGHPKDETDDNAEDRDSVCNPPGISGMHAH